MYGGVSLAIYMNGVANELFRAVRGRGVYKLFKQLTDSDVVVDIVSGASAGGINGMFLAFALCNEREFSECADLWRKQGDIQDLLRKTTAPAHTQTSLLDSEAYYEPQLAAAFRKMWNRPIDAQHSLDAPSRLSELDLFVAGTDFNGRRSTTVDCAAHVIEVKDYRARFWLKHRAGRKAQLDPRADGLGRAGDGGPPASSVAADARGTEAVLPEAGFAAFARLARITSCFPAAFSPVKLEVPAELRAGEVDAKDAAVGRKLGVWGALDPGAYHFLDGGILDNKPFTSTVEAIFYRMANRPVQRHLLYVEPDPERFADEQKRVPTFLSSALDSLTRLPSYESISGDLQQIGKHNDSIERYKRTCAELRNWVMSAPATPSEPPSSASRPRDEGRAIYERARLQALADLVGEGLLNLEPGTRLDDRARGQMAELRVALDQAMAEVEARTRGAGTTALGLFKRYDVEFRLRRLMHLTYVLMPPARGRPRNEGDPPERESAPTPAELLEPQKAHEALVQIGHRIALQEIVRAKLLRAIERSAPVWRELPPQQVWGQVLERLDAVLDLSGLPRGVIAALAGEGQCQEQLESLGQALEVRTDPEYRAPPGARDSLLVLADEGEAVLMKRFAAAQPAASHTERGPLEHEYQRFEALDQVLFPIQFVAGLREQDIIRTVRVSPLDAQRGCSAGNFADKVTGETLAHFGAFLKRSWRSNDILYGRLDGACQLLETLLNPSWLRTALENPRQRELVLRSFGVGAEAQRDGTLRSVALERWLSAPDIFPRAGQEAIERVARALSGLLDPAALPDFEQRISGAAYGELLDALVEATHFSILQDDYAKLIQDSVDEQLAWRSGKVATTGAQAPSRAAQPQLDPQTRAFDLTLDNLAVEVAARQFANAALAGKQESRELAQLLGNYHVGRESIAGDIPPSVLFELAAHALLILRNCVINSFGPAHASAIRGHRGYIVFVDWPLRAFHALAVLVRRRPAHGGIALGLLAYFLLALLVDLCFFDSLWKLQGWRGYLGTLLFVGLPLGCLFAATALVGASEYSWKSVQSSHLRLARSVLSGMGWSFAGLAVLAPVYVAYAYVAATVSGALQPVLCKASWLPAGSCSRAGYVVVLAVAVAISFGIGRRTAPGAGPGPLRRALNWLKSKLGNGGDPPASSGRGAGAGALAWPAE